MSGWVALAMGSRLSRVARAVAVVAATGGHWHAEEAHHFCLALVVAGGDVTVANAWRRCEYIRLQTANARMNKRDLLFVTSCLLRGTP